MEALIGQSLVVDSSFRSRTQLISDLQASGLSSTIRPASSIADGLHCLQTIPLNACFIGSSITQERAVDFVRKGTELSISKSCAFVAVVENDTARAAALAEAGAHGVLKKPYDKVSFTDLVTRAVKQASRSTEAVQSLIQNKGRAISPMEIIQVEQELSVLLRESASRLRDVSAKILQGKLVLLEDGLPSLATRDAIRLAVELALGTTSLARQIGTFDNHFVTTVIDWFSDRVHQNQTDATEALRHRLIDYKTPESQ